MSKSMMIALQESENEEVMGTAKVCGMMNDFFDCTNFRSNFEHDRKRNPFIKSYTSLKDERFFWLLEKFFKYLDVWKKSVSTRPGNFFENEGGKMFLSVQTYEGYKISAYSYVEAIQFLLQQGFRMSCRSGSCKMYWRITLATNAAREENQVTQLSNSSAAMILQLLLIAPVRKC